MGIKFRCPKGHKLNVKSFLAGKRAFCPKCGVSLVVPTLEESEAGGSALTAAGTEIVGEKSMEIETVPAEPGTARGTFETEVTTKPVDPIDEAPSAVWYVRPATGGQFGPASGEIMRSWLNEGRVAATSLVWRAGWSEWRPAATVFPQWSATLAVPGSGAPPAQSTTMAPAAPEAGNGPPPIGSGSPPAEMLQSAPADPMLAGPSESGAGMAPLAESARRRRRQHDRRLYLSAVLVVVSVILFVLLFVVFQRQGQQADPQSQEAPPAAEDPLE